MTIQLEALAGTRMPKTESLIKNNFMHCTQDNGQLHVRSQTWLAFPTYMYKNKQHKQYNNMTLIEVFLPFFCCYFCLEAAETVEEKTDEVPEIKVDTVEPEEGTPSKKKNVTASPARGKKAKPLNEVPDQGILLKGSLHRKKGTFGGWEKAFCYVTYSAMYFTSGEDVREYHLMCPFNTGSGMVNKEKKGHDKQSEGLLVKSGKTKEILSLPNGELRQWKEVLENVLGLAGGCELLSEDEDDVEPGAAAPEIQQGEGLYTYIIPPSFSFSPSPFPPPPPPFSPFSPGLFRAVLHHSTV